MRKMTRKLQWIPCEILSSKELCSLINIASSRIEEKRMKSWLVLRQQSRHVEAVLCHKIPHRSPPQISNFNASTADDRTYGYLMIFSGSSQWETGWSFMPSPKKLSLNGRMNICREVMSGRCFWVFHEHHPSIMRLWHCFMPCTISTQPHCPPILWASLFRCDRAIRVKFVKFKVHPASHRPTPPNRNEWRRVAPWLPHTNIFWARQRRAVTVASFHVVAFVETQILFWCAGEKRVFLKQVQELWNTRRFLPVGFASHMRWGEIYFDF